MKKVSGLLFCLLCSNASAHLPPPWKLPPGSGQPGGGGGTQNVVAGPIKRRPVTNAVTGPKALPTGDGVLTKGSSNVVLSDVHVQALFLGVEWLDPFMAKDKIAGIDQFLRGYSSSRYAAAIDEYVEPGGTSVVGNYQYDGYLRDDALILGQESESKVQELVCGLVDQGVVQLPTDGRGFLAVYSSHKRPALSACGSHGWLVCMGNHRFYYAFSYNLDQDPECAVKDLKTGHSEGLAAIANESARALADFRTDADFLGWKDQYGNEVDDKCAWVFSVPYVTFPDGSKWKLQDLWSNKAYEAGTGAPNAWGQRGCVNGQ